MTAPADRLSAEPPPVPVAVNLPITLGQFAKLAGLAATGGDAKRLVTAGLVRVNGFVEMRRGHRLRVGDVIEAEGESPRVVTDRGGGREESPQAAEQALAGSKRFPSNKG
jgi:ribosome-associated protein